MSLINIEEWGGYPDGSDTTPAWNEALYDIENEGYKGLQFGRGRYYFHTKPDPVTFDGFYLKGHSPYTTQLRKEYEPKVLYESFIHIQGRGGGGGDFHLEASPETTAGYGLRFYADNDTGPGGKQHFSHVRIAGTVLDDGLHHGTWRCALHVDGSQRTIAPIGMRGVYLEDFEIFDSTLWLVVFWGAIACEWHGGSAVMGGGTARGICVGGPMSTLNRIDANVDWSRSSIVPSAMRGPGK